MKKSITLFSYVTSPYAMKVHCYLLFKKLSFDIHYVNPLRPEKELPTGRQVPVLDINGTTKADSSLIGHCLDDIFPETKPMLPSDDVAKQRVLEMDTWINDTLIPIVFYSIYPDLKNTNLYNTLRLGYCVNYTTSSRLLPGIRFLWPVFIHRAGFIRRMVKPLKRKACARTSRQNALSYLDDVLKEQRYLASDDKPSIADLSAWPQLVVPYEFGLKNIDNFTSYPNIMRWIKEIGSHLHAPDLPPLVPEQIRKRKLL